MKKLTALFITLLLLVFSCVSTSAEVDKDKLTDDFIKYREELDGITYESNIYGSIFLGRTIEENGILYFECGSWPLNFVDGYKKIIGDLYFHTRYTIGPGGLCLFVQSEDKIYDLETAYNTGVITDLSIAYSFLNSDKITPIGDVDDDDTVTIKDATAIQKHLVNLDTKLIHESLRSVIMDTDRDSNITVRDATVIQKRLAGLES